MHVHVEAFSERLLQECEEVNDIGFLFLVLRQFRLEILNFVFEDFLKGRTGLWVYDESAGEDDIS
jgi:hypothetical protein